MSILGYICCIIPCSNTEYILEDLTNPFKFWLSSLENLILWEMYKEIKHQQSWRWSYFVQLKLANIKVYWLVITQISETDDISHKN